MKVVLKDLTKKFSGQGKNAPDVIAVNNFNVEIPDGKLIGLLGPSGCGKSTALNLISGLLSPTAGRIFFGEDDVTDLPPENRGVGLVFQNYALYPHLTVKQNILFPLQNLKGEDKLSKEEMLARAYDAAKLVQIEGLMDRKPKALSGGQQQRVSFARALAYGKDCILFDEPLSALDAKLREEMRSEIRDLVTRLHVTAVFVTHDQIEAMSMSDRIAVLSRGIIEQYDTPEIIYSHPASPFTARFVGTANWLDAHHLFRPEKGHLESREKDVFYEANVVSSQFQGQNYQIRLTRKGQTWTLPAERAMPQGSPVRICVSPYDIIEV